MAKSGGAVGATGVAEERAAPSPNGDNGGRASVPLSLQGTPLQGSPVRASARSRRPRPLVSETYRARKAREEADEPATSEERWRSRPALGMVVRLAVLAIPSAAAVGSAIVISRLVPRPHGAWASLGWWALVIASSTAVLFLVDRLSRRLLPLAALLRLSLAFPDRAPSRFSVAFKAGTTRNLKEKLAQTKRHGVDDEPARCAEQVLEFVAALSRHDRATRGHSERVRAFNDLITEEMGLPEKDRERLRWAALLHDVGKLEVPAKILNKPAKPTPAELHELRRHPVEGALITAPLAEWLGPWRRAIEEHHERWDGVGYPKGLAGEEISLGARIVAVADTFEVMTAPRPYKRPVNAEAARKELARCAGSHFDPAVVRAFLNISLGRLRLAMGPMSWLAQLPFVGSVPSLDRLARSAATAAGTAGVGAIALGGLVGPTRGTSPPPALGNVPAPQASPAPQPAVASPAPPAAVAGAALAPSELTPAAAADEQRRAGRPRLVDDKADPAEPAEPAPSDADRAAKSTPPRRPRLIEHPPVLDALPTAPTTRWAVDTVNDTVDSLSP